MKNFKLRFLCLFLSLLFTVPANAGVVKKLVEVDSAERERLEQERIAQQQAYEEEAKKQAELRRLEEEKRIAAEAKAARDRQLREAAILREKEIDSANVNFLKRLAALAANSNADKKKEGSCSFFCSLWKLITYPIVVVAKAFGHHHH